MHQIRVNHALVFETPNYCELEHVAYTIRKAFIAAEIEFKHYDSKVFDSNDGVCEYTEMFLTL